MALFSASALRRLVVSIVARQAYRTGRMTASIAWKRAVNGLHKVEKRGGKGQSIGIGEFFSAFLLVDLFEFLDGFRG